MSKVSPRHGLSDIGYYMVGISKLPGFDKVAKLSSNESPLGMSRKAVQAAKAALAKSHLYPEVDGEDLRAAIADHFDLEPGRIAFGPGSDELLLRLVTSFVGAGDEVVFSKNAYMQFPIYAKRGGAKPVAAPDRDFHHCVDSLLANVTDRTKVMIIANPDNPSGTYLPSVEVRRLRRELPGHVLLIIDAAYEEYALAPDYESGTNLVSACDNVVVTRTFSKIFGMAGLRLGWCYGPPEIIDLLERVGPSFPTNVAASAAALAALHDREHTRRVLDHNAKWLGWFSERLQRIGLKVYPSQTNFVLVGFPGENGKTATLANSYLQAAGIIARQFAVPGFEDKLRFTIGTGSEMRKAASALGRFLAV